MRYEINDMYVGQTAQFTKTISESDVYLFAGITGAQNPMQVNDVYAKQTRYGERIVHGMLSSSLISTVIGTSCQAMVQFMYSRKLNLKHPYSSVIRLVQLWK